MSVPFLNQIILVKRGVIWILRYQRNFLKAKYVRDFM